MTLPDERTRAVLQTREFLIYLTNDATLPNGVRQTARRLLRHFPDTQHLAALAEMYERLNMLSLEDDWLRLRLSHGSPFEHPERC